MKAAHYSRYGNHEVFSIVEKARPIPAENEVLVKVICTTVNRTDTGMTSASYFVSRFITGLAKPKKSTPGTDFSGVIASIGSSVTKFKEGDEIFGFNDTILRSQAEYMVIKEDGNIISKPSNVSHEAAAASCEGAHYAINTFKIGGVKSGDHILVYGATGAIGSAAVQLAKKYGAKVDAVANTENLAMVKDLGAEVVYDYLTEDFTKSPKIYNFIFDAVGKSSFKICKPLLAENGIYISSELGKNGINIWLAISNRRVKFPFPTDIKNTLNVMQQLLIDENFSPVIDRSYNLEQIVDAYKYVESGQKTGNVILRIQ